MEKTGIIESGSRKQSNFSKSVEIKWLKASGKQESSLNRVTNDDKLRAMLGYKMMNSGDMNPIFWREDFCSVCGCQHRNPDVLDTYQNCERCQNPLRLMLNLRNRYGNLEPQGFLEILFASYGDLVSEMGAVDVTFLLKDMMANKNTDKYLYLPPSSNLRKLFGIDPSPDNPKQLRIRYRMGSIFGTLMINVTSNNRVINGIALRPPINNGQRLLNIKRAYYGHPKGVSTTGRMCYEVTEYLQGLIDLGGGSFLSIPENTLMSHLFGDPCPGYHKELRIEFELSGRSGET